MNVWGHVAFGHALATRMPWKLDQLRSRALPVIVGALIPDVVDKTLKIAHIYPWGRTVCHSAYVLTLFALVALLIKRQWFIWFVAGWVSHLFVDLTDDVICGVQATGYVFATWYAWPYYNPDLYPVIVTPIYASQSCSSVYETFVTLWALYIARLRLHRN